MQSTILKKAKQQKSPPEDLRVRIEFRLYNNQYNEVKNYLVHSLIFFLYLVVQNLFNMRANDIIKEIQRLPISKRIYVVEKTIHSIRKQEDKNVMKKAAETLYVDYKTDNELTSFSNLDFADFYEAK